MCMCLLQDSIQKLQEEAARLGRSQMLLAVRARVLGLCVIVGRVFVTTYSFAVQQWNKLNSFSIKVGSKETIVLYFLKKT